MNIGGISTELGRMFPDLPMRLSESMSRHTTFRIGGPADIWCRPVDMEQLVAVIRFASERQIPYLVIGNGSNLLVRDGGIRGIVIETTSLDRITLLPDDMIESECGASLTKLASFALANGLKGLEFAYGIPGTVGGAVYMNAGAFGGEMKNCVVETDYADPRGTICTLCGDEHMFEYRQSFFTHNPGLVILRTRIRLEKDEPDRIREKMKELSNKRQVSQPLQYPSAGSFFKRPKGHFAGKLISDCGLKGLACGNARISEMHAGFIINEGDATCEDVLMLMDIVRREVYQRFGVSLEPEAKIVGED
jgi:UDP-N-acetylmuramate dehydrogenase